MVKFHTLFESKQRKKSGKLVEKEVDQLMQKMIQDVYRFIKDQSLLRTGDRVLVACSGGVDSVALLHFLATNRQRMKIEVAAVHVDHMLRGKESASDGTFVRDLCEALDISFFGGQVPVPEIMHKTGGNVQAVCREGRYAFFSEVMEKERYNVLATAHHAEDQLETVLMQVTKGGTPSGIPIQREVDGGILIRPFLPARKASLYLYVKAHGLKFREDPSNASDVYTRNRFRQQIVPHILAESPAAAEKSVLIGERLQEDEKFLETLAQERLADIIQFTEEGLPSIDQDIFNDVPTALQRRMIPLLLGYLYDEEKVAVSYKTALIGQLLHHLSSDEGNVSIDLPLGYRFVRAYDRLSFMKEDGQWPDGLRKKLCQGKKNDWNDWLWLYWTTVKAADPQMLAAAKDVMYFNVPDECLPLSVRQWEEGDRIMLPGMNHSKRLSRLFIDEKVSRAERSRLPIVVTAQDEVCAVPGLRYGIRFTRNRKVDDKYIFIMGQN